MPLPWTLVPPLLLTVLQALDPHWSLGDRFVIFSFPSDQHNKIKDSPASLAGAGPCAPADVPGVSRSQWSPPAGAAGRCPEGTRAGLGTCVPAMASRSSGASSSLLPPGCPWDSGLIYWRAHHGVLWGTSPGQSSDFLKRHSSNPLCPWGPLLLPCSFGPLPLVFLLSLPIHTPRIGPPPALLIPPLCTSPIQIFCTLVSRGPTFLGLAVYAGGGSSSTLGKPYSKCRGGPPKVDAFPSSHRRRWEWPGTLWPEAFPWWVSWLLPGPYLLSHPFPGPVLHADLGSYWEEREAEWKWGAGVGWLMRPPV